jgi:plasmid stability protein
MGKNVQIRALDDATYAVLRARAAAADLSLTQYLRQELTRLADSPTWEELLERADRRRDRGGGASRAAVEAAFDADRADRR